MKKNHLIQLLFFVALGFNFQTICAQEQHAIDSLLNRLKTTTIDTIKVDVLNTLCQKYQRSNPEKAEDYAMQALKLAKEAAYKKGVANSFNNIGILKKNHGNYNKAIENYQNALKIQKELGNKKGIAKSLHKIGIIHYYQSNYDKTIEYFQKALRIFQELEDKIGIASCLNNIGIVHEEYDNYNKAIEYHQKSLKIDKELRDKKGIAKSLNNIGIIHFYQGKYDKAIKNFQKSLKIKKELGDKIGIAKSLTNIGVIHQEQANYGNAIEYFQKSLKIEYELGDIMGIAGSLNNIGMIYRKQGNYDKAIENYQKSLKIYQEMGDKKGIASCLNNIGNTHSDQGKYDKTIEYIQKALKIYQETRDKKRIASCLNNIGNTHYHQGNYDKAIEYHQNALKTNREIGAKIEIVYSANLLGNLHLKKSNFKEALNIFQKALIENMPDFNDSVVFRNPQNLYALSKPYLLKTLSSKAKTFRSMYHITNSINDLKASLSTFDLVFKLVYEMRNDYSHESAKLLLSEETKTYYADALQAAFDYYKTNPDNKSREKAFFAYLEKSKSATLNAHLNDINIKSYLNIADSLLEKEKDIAKNRRLYETKIQKEKAKRNGYDTLQVNKFQDKLFDCSRQYDSLINIFKQNYPDYYKLKYEQQVASSQAIQNQLSKTQVLLNYFVADTLLFIAAVTNDTVVYKQVKTMELFNQRVLDYHIDIKYSMGESEFNESAVFYNWLIQPVEEIIKDKSHLIIIPDGYLHYLPFETLCKNLVYPGNLSKAGFLIKKHAITYHQSATLWLNSLKKQSRARNNNFIGFAPVFAPKVNNGYILSSEWISDNTNIEKNTRSISNDFKHFNALPYSEKEIKTILKLFKRSGKKGDGYFYKEASEENFKQQAPNYKYVHIASHSFTNDYYPALSGIAFSQPDTTGFNPDKQEDGTLYAGESYNLDLSGADLVVLSSCQSGLGKLVKGEGFLSLSRGFLYAGTSNIIFSLWNVKDLQTRELMAHFYLKLLEGQTYADAMRSAKLKLIKNPKNAEPKYWAAWMLVGK